MNIISAKTKSSRLARRRFPPVRALFALCLALAGCQLADSVITPVFMPSEAEELEILSQFRPELEKGLVMVDDPLLVDYVRRVGRKVIENSPHASPFATEFYVVHDTSLNAFAVPGGLIYVHTGLLHAAEDEAEVAGVLAHEYGHVVFRHGAKHMSRASGYSAIQNLILGRNAGQISKMVGNVLATGAVSKHGRNDELEADSIAVPTLHTAGYDPEGLITFFQRLKETYGEPKPGLMTTISAYSASHPATAERIERVRGQVGLLPPNAKERPINDLRRVQARIEDLGLTEEPPAAEPPPAQ